MICKFLSKTLQNGFKCKKYKNNISYPFDCKNCSDFVLKRMKPIKRVGKNKITVKPKIYDQVSKRDNYRCQLADITCEGGLELHHIIYRSENKNLINEPTNCIMLCNRHHRLVHSNKHLWQPMLIEKIKKLLQKSLTE